MSEMLQAQAGDILMVGGDSLLDESIQWISHGDYCHTAIFISPTKLYEAQGGRTLGECDLSYYLNNDKVTKLEIWTDPTWTDEERKLVPTVAKKYEGIHYDLPVIPLEILHFELGASLDWYDSKGKLDCSEFVNAMGLEFDKQWSELKHPAPVDLPNGGKLVRKLVLK